ncbi:MAG: DUF4435 domain-containing protein [Methylococcales bacterium]
MTSSLINYSETTSFSSDYQEAVDSFLRKSEPKTILVLVEAINDISFWYSVLNKYEKREKIKFDIVSYSSDSLATGKKELRKHLNKSGEYLLICLDSDYDYLLPNNSDEAKEINQNHYIFQTYAHSMENLKCYAESLSNVCVQATKNTNEKINFPNLLKKYSEIVYPLFIWNLYFYNIQNCEAFPKKDLSSIIQVTKEFKSDEYEEILEILRIDVTSKLQALQNQFPVYQYQIDIFSKLLNNIGLNNDNAYLFVDGHALYTTILMFLKPLCKELSNEHRQKIETLARTKEEKKENINYYNNSIVKVETVLSINENFKECFLFKKIENDIENYLKSTIA